MLISDINLFHKNVGELIMFCQCIEHDIKWIYAGMLKGDVDENFVELQRTRATLGTTIAKLESLDNSRDPYLSQNDYKLLKDVNNIRIHWAHNAYLEFIYCDNREYQENFIRQARRLENDYNRLQKLSDKIEKIRLNVLKVYGRI